LADLTSDGLAPDDVPAVLLSEGEDPDPLDAALPGVVRWRLVPGPGVEVEFPAEATHLFILADGRLNPVDQVEGWKGWLEARGLKVARVLCVVHCQLAEKHPKLIAWYEACIHYSDVVLLSRRDGVSNKWIGDFRRRFEDRYHPCLFEFVKAGKVANPALILTAEARRMAHVFDEQEWVVVDEEDDEEEQEAGEEEVEMKPEEDHYFERRNGGRRVHEIPNIADFLPPRPA
jgi:hypothetical protein